MSLEPKAVRRSFHAVFVKTGSPHRAVGEKKYLKSKLRFYGVPLPSIRKTVRDYCVANPAMSRDDLLTIVFGLWDAGYHELRSAGIALLERRRTLLNAKDMTVVEQLVRRSDTWAYVDWLAVKISGNIVLDHRTAKRALPRWSRDTHMWVRRSSMLSLLPSLKREEKDFPMFARFAASMIEEKEFFIRKAIGWVLREVGKKRPSETFQFLNEHIEVVSGLTLREGSKYLPAPERATLLDRYTSRTG